MQLRPHPKARLHCSGSSQHPQRLRNEYRSAMRTVREQRCRYEQLRRIFEVPYILIIGKLKFRHAQTTNFEPVLKTPLPPQEGVSKTRSTLSSSLKAKRNCAKPTPPRAEHRTYVPTTQARLSLPAPAAVSSCSPQTPPDQSTESRPDKAAAKTSPRLSRPRPSRHTPR